MSCMKKSEIKAPVFLGNEIKAPVFLSNKDAEDFLNLLKEYQERPKSSPCYECETEALLVASEKNSDDLTTAIIFLLGIIMGIIIGLIST